MEVEGNNGSVTSLRKTEKVWNNSGKFKRLHQHPQNEILRYKENRIYTTFMWGKL